MFPRLSRSYENTIYSVLRKLLHTSKKHYWKTSVSPELDFEYLCNNNNIEEIKNNINIRKGIGNIELVNKLKRNLNSTHQLHESYENLETKFYNEALKIPNKTHPAVCNLKDEPQVVKHLGTKKDYTFNPYEFHDIARHLNLIRTEQLGNVAGNRSYYFLGEMAELEQALIRYTINTLLQKNFELISVPDILHRSVIEACGLNTSGVRTQVYTLDPQMYGSNLCLSGTSEMALAAHFMNKIIPEENLPLKVAAVSRCYRAEISSIAEERGIYRVHQFTKVEMFALSKPELSEELLEEFREIEEQHFQSLGLYLRTLDMPPHELGAPAYRKYDVEAWLPGKNMFGEISSCSNCTDYQSRRLNIKYKRKNGDVLHVHTLNGTACAVPRMLIAISETFQTDRGYFEIPTVLQKYMRNKTAIGKQKKIPHLKLSKQKIP